jgi:carbon-monoxide dehydrogenase large subunit
MVGQGLVSSRSSAKQEETMSTTNVGRFGSGREVKRVEDAALLQGQGRFTDDVQPAGQLVIRFVRSDHARGRIVSIDAAAARAVPGVVAVYTGADLVAAGVKPMPPVEGFPRPDGKPIDPPVRHALAVGTVNFANSPVPKVRLSSKA